MLVHTAVRRSSYVLIGKNDVRWSLHFCPEIRRGALVVADVVLQRQIGLLGRYKYWHISLEAFDLEKISCWLETPVISKECRKWLGVIGFWCLSNLLAEVFGSDSCASLSSSMLRLKSRLLYHLKELIDNHFNNCTCDPSNSSLMYSLVRLYVELVGSIGWMAHRCNLSNSLRKIIHV